MNPLAWLLNLFHTKCPACRAVTLVVLADDGEATKYRCLSCAQVFLVWRRWRA
jgi:predicted Zn finger-like uncharacterized protein